MKAKMRGTRFVPVAALLLVGLAGAAHADLKVVTETKFSGLPAAAKAAAPELGNGTPLVTTTYYKGDKSRVEAPSGITITQKSVDGSSTEVYTLNPTLKTYYVTAPQDALKGMGDNPMLAMLKIDSKVFVNPGTDNRTILGKSTKDYRYMAVFKMSMAGGDPSMSAMFPTITLKGEQWAADSITVPATASGTASPDLIKSMPMLGKGMKEFRDKLAQIKGFPLRNVTTLTISFPPGSPALAMGGDSVPREPITTLIEVKSLSEDPLSDDLFTVPADYKKVDPPPTPGLPGGAGGAPALPDGPHPAP